MIEYNYISSNIITFYSLQSIPLKITSLQSLRSLEGTGPSSFVDQVAPNKKIPENKQFLNLKWIN